MKKYSEQTVLYWFRCSVKQCFVLVALSVFGLVVTPPAWAYQMFPAHFVPFSLSWNPTGTLIAVGGVDLDYCTEPEDSTEILIVDPLTNQTVHQIDGHRCPVYAVAWSPTGDKLASIGAAEPGFIWETVTWQPIARLSSPAYAGRGGVSLSWSPDSTRLAVAHQDRPFVFIYDGTTGATLEILSGYDDDVEAVAWSPNGNQIAAGDKSGKVIVWDAITYQPVVEYSNTVSVFALAWSPDSTSLAIGNRSGNLTINDISASSNPIILQLHQDIIWSMSWNKHAPQLATASVDRSVKVIDVHTGEIIDTIQADKAVLAIGYDPSGSSLAYLDGINATLQVIDAPGVPTANAGADQTVIDTER